MSVASNVTQRLWSSPLAGAAATFGVGAGLFAGGYDFLHSEGKLSDRAESAGESFIGYGFAGSMGALGAGVAIGTGAAFRAGIRGYQPGQRNAMSDIGFGIGDWAKKEPAAMVSSAGSRVADYGKTIGDELKAGEWKKTLQRPGVGVGLGAVLGGVIGSQVSDDPTKGAMEGAAIGAGAGVVAGRAMKATQVWGKWGAGRKTGGLLAASLVVGGALKLLNADQPEVVDQASEQYRPEYSSVRDRMDRMSAGGDLVFGLHKKR